MAWPLDASPRPPLRFRQPGGVLGRQRRPCRPTVHRLRPRRRRPPRRPDGPSPGDLVRREQDGAAARRRRSRTGVDPGRRTARDEIFTLELHLPVYYIREDGYEKEEFVMIFYELPGSAMLEIMRSSLGGVANMRLKYNPDFI